MEGDWYDYIPRVLTIFEAMFHCVFNTSVGLDQIFIAHEYYIFQYLYRYEVLHRRFSYRMMIRTLKPRDLYFTPDLRLLNFDVKMKCFNIY